MDATPATAQFYGMLQVEHLVVDDVFEHITRYGRMIEDAADNDGVMGGVVVPQDAPGFSLAPAHTGAGHKAVEEARVQVFEDCLQIVEVTARGAKQLTSTHLADQMGFANDLVAADVLAIASSVGAVDGASVHLGQQDMGDCFENGVRRAFEEVREAD